MFFPQFVKPNPPPSLSKENLAIWTSWFCKGDREVAREAAAKGNLNNLVNCFLAQRRRIPVDDAGVWYKHEVLVWVDELLERKQIYRASHVLQNIGLNAVEELSQIFRKTSNKELRDYVGGHLLKQNSLSDNLKQLWDLLNLIVTNSVFNKNHKLQEESVQCLDMQSNKWKAEIATKYFLGNYDERIKSFVTPEEVWSQLIKFQDNNLLTTWINVQFNENFTVDLNDTLLEIFKSFSITSQLLDQLENYSNYKTTQNTILNELSKFGVFNVTDSSSFLNIIQRLNHTNSLPRIYKILEDKSATIKFESYTNLLIDYCLQNKLYVILNICLKQFQVVHDKHSIYLKLINSFRKLVNEFSETILRDNILLVAKFYSDNLIEYFEKNPILLIALILFTKELPFEQIQSLTICNEDLSEAFPKVLDKLFLVKTILNKDFDESLPNVYELLEHHVNNNLKSLFEFRVKNKEILHFNTKELSRLGYNKKNSCLFFVRQNRPSIAAKFFALNRTENKIIVKKVYKLAMKNFTQNDLIASCIIFLELIGENSDHLRISSHAANILFKSHDFLFIRSLFLNIENEAVQIQTLLESVLMANINSNLLISGSEFIKAITSYEIAIKFSVLNNIKLPEEFLKHCATNNLWFSFLLFAQIYNYPPEQIKLVLQCFKNPTLLEHVSHSVVHDIQIDDQNVLMKERDSRKYFLSRIGVRKSLDSLNQNIDSSLTSQSSFGSGCSSTGSELLEIDISNRKTTLVQTLIRCHNSTDPPRALLQACQLYQNPLLAIFATSYEPDSVVTNWLTWLAVSSELYETFTNFESIAICAKSVTNLLDDCMKERFSKTLELSFEIFIPDNPLRTFITFINLCINKTYNIQHLKPHLKQFKNALTRSRRNSILTDNDHEMTYLNSKSWIETTALRLVSSAIEYNCDSLYEKYLFVKCLKNVELNSYISGCPNFENIIEILQLVYECHVRVFNVAEVFDNKTSRKAIIDSINKLLDQQQFENALKVAQLESLPLDLILIKQWENKFLNRTVLGLEFWSECDFIMRSNHVTADCVVDFYQECLNKLSKKEKYYVLKLSRNWAFDFELSSRYELEHKMWLSFIDLDEVERDLNELKATESEMTYSEMIKLLDSVPVFEMMDFGPILTAALNNGNFWLVLKLSKMFRCKSLDLDMLKLCHSLAEGLVLPYQLTAEQRMLVMNGANYRRLSNRRTFLSTRLSSFSSASHSVTNLTYGPVSDGFEAPTQDTLALLHSLTEKMSNGAEQAFKIFMKYRISINIEIPYHIIVYNTDYMKMLKDSLSDNCLNPLEVVHDFINVYKWTREEIADFICAEIVSAATHYIQSKNENFIMWELNIDQEFSAVLQLLRDNCSILGYKLYSHASAVYKHHESANFDYKMSDLTLVTLLLITSHDCFTADCNMEGISTILKKCQAVINLLLTLRSWKLIVKLLTGVARYTEMSYVFQMLKEHDQFEFLLSKGSRKDNGLKTALLDFLKKYCPDNKELYKLVALHFALFSEVALLWEREAQSLIRNLIAISKLEMQNNKLNPATEQFVLLSNSDGTKLCLNKAIENYVHATEFHLQGEKLAKAMTAAKQAELIGLQLSLLKSSAAQGFAKSVLSLNTSQITALVSFYLSFDEAYILIQSYNYTADWATILFEQCIVRNEKSYLDNFLEHFTLTESLVHDISRKFLNANINTPQEMSSMKNLLTKLPSIHTKYRIASELGFVDVVEDLIAGGQLAYLKDTVWKRGYKS